MLTMSLLEGAFCVWEAGELVDILGDDAAALFSYRYGVKEQGNVDPEQDPHNELEKKVRMIIVRWRSTMLTRIHRTSFSNNTRSRRLPKSSLHLKNPCQIFCKIPYPSCWNTAKRLVQSPIWMIK